MGNFAALIAAVAATMCSGAGAQTAQIHLLWARGEVAAQDVSADGGVVVGQACEAPAGRSRWFRWTLDSGLGIVGDDSLEGVALGVSGDGTVLVGVSSTIAHIWTEATGPVSLGPLDQQRKQTTAQAASFDGGVVVGTGVGGNVLPLGWVWRESTGMVSLGGFDDPDGRSSAADVTADGGSIVGLVEDSIGIRPAEWTEAAGWQVLENAPEWGTQGGANAVSSDGEYVVGGIVGDGGVWWAFRWQRSTGAFDVLEQDITAKGDFYAADVSDDGGLVVGAIEDGNSNRAVVWDPVHGVRLLSDVLESEHGVDLSQWTLQRANGLSRDGRVIAGEGRFLGTNYTVGFVVILDAPPCVADFNQDGAVNTLDVLAFLNAWNADDPRADINGDGLINTQDVLKFLNLWNGGC